MTKTRLGRGACDVVGLPGLAGAALAVPAGAPPSAGTTLARVRTAGAAIAVSSFRDGMGILP